MVDWRRCEGHALCAHLVPELIHLDERGFPVILAMPVPSWLKEDADQAVDGCPMRALRLATDPERAAGKEHSSGKYGPVGG
jgi:ferredoxin